MLKAPGFDSRNKNVMNRFVRFSNFAFNGFKLRHYIKANRECIDAAQLSALEEGLAGHWHVSVLVPDAVGTEGLTHMARHHATQYETHFVVPSSHDTDS